jgi:hypothetical protein
VLLDEPVPAPVLPRGGWACGMTTGTGVGIGVGV